MSEEQKDHNNFNVIDWLNSYFEGQKGKEIKAVELEPVLQFSLLWNMFEAIVFRGRTGNEIHKIEESVKELNEAGGIRPRPSFTFALSHFRKRYLNENHTVGRRFNSLFDSRTEAGKRKAKSALEDNEQSLDSQICALLIMASRFRNKLFHGGKTVYTLNNQASNFKVVNQILAAYLELLKEAKQIKDVRYKLS